MKLTRVQIRNFRSIADATIDFNPTCRIFIGINEAGKSNVLKAMSMMEKGVNPTKDDIRQPLPDEPPVSESYVRVIFRLTGEELDLVYDKVGTETLFNDEAAPLVARSGKDLTLAGFVGIKNEGLFIIDVKGQKKSISYWKVSDEYQLVSGWKKPSSACPDTFEIKNEEGEDVKLKEMKLVNSKEYSDIPEAYLEEVTTENLDAIVGKHLVSVVEEKMPDVLYWRYEEKNLLPPQISIESFGADPGVCIPLKNMFQLAGHEEVSTAIKESKGIGGFAFRNLLKRVADRTTQHFRSVWKDYKTIEFILNPNGPSIDAGVKEKFNDFEFAKRSDGFKRFATFLLLVSTKVKTEQMMNTLLIIDEPDTSLHPSGARFLRDELIKIAEKNYVVYSTHSIFMIDGKNIRRHIIVKKDDEKTLLSEANESNIFDEEVLYNALGHSVFENLREKNILFEGWTDKYLFSVALEKVPAEHGPAKKALKDVGRCHARGVSHIKAVTPLMELAGRKLLILSDNDKAAQDKQREYSKLNGFGTWRRYDEVLPSTSAATAEDFIKPRAFKDAIKEARGMFPGLAELTDDDIIHPKGKIYKLRSWLESGGLTEDEEKQALEVIKNRLFSELKNQDIEKEYYDYVSEVSKITDSMA